LCPRDHVAGEGASTQMARKSAAEKTSYETRPLDASTWDAFAELVERNNGVYGGCWCIVHHSEYQRGVSDPRPLKEERATVELFEEFEFDRVRQVGKHAWIMSREIDAA
jgi:hypothetical protein